MQGKADEMIEKFIDFVDAHSSAEDESYEKTYTLDDLRTYIPYFLDELKHDEQDQVEFSQVVVYENRTGCVLAMIPMNGGNEVIVQQGIGIRAFKKGTEPVLVGKNGQVVLKQNAVIIGSLHRI